MDEQLQQGPEPPFSGVRARRGSDRAGTGSPRRARPPPPGALGEHAGRHLRGRRARHGGPVPDGIAPPGRRRWLPLGHAARQPDRLLRHRVADSAHRARRTSGPPAPPTRHHRLPGRMDDLFHPGRRRHAVGQARRRRHLRRLPGGHRRRWTGAGRGGALGRTKGRPTRELLPHSRPRPRRGTRRRRRCRSQGAAHPPHRHPAFGPTAPRHHDRQCLRVPAARHTDRALPVPRARAPRPGRGRGGAVRRLHDLVHRQLGNGAPAPHGPPHRGRRLHARWARRVPRRGGRPASVSWLWPERPLRARTPQRAGRCRPGAGPRMPG